MNMFFSKREAFKEWKARRPFWGATLTILSGLVILWIPIQLYEVAIVPGSILFSGFFLGGLVFLLGVMSYAMPKLSTVFGIITIFSAVLSIMGALGGFLVGTILGIIGGALCIAWKPELAVVETSHLDLNNDHSVENEIASGIMES
ncbi:DUF6114 domain-containing protein [Anoxybacteroides amylolyticum]|uniref:Uncharacterized protein n=1 Tax=Anoxybacteroides amylolyticum TaxID=294699 RepID=A0A160F1G8_9BACL|nr:DUF6114 domain-containing protein [Anoxybacillus amylolyticus]ANB59452.1 hypothetical protein GFC30_2482 [Anoxybacillus amylolyticus]